MGTNLTIAAVRTINLPFVCLVFAPLKKAAEELIQSIGQAAVAHQINLYYEKKEAKHLTRGA